MSEWIFRSVASAILIGAMVGFLAGVLASLSGLRLIWTEQVDVGETLSPRRFLETKTKEQIRWIVTRDKYGLYQDRKLVGKTTRDPSKLPDGKFLFAELSETSQLDTSKPFEYGREIFKVISREGLYHVAVMSDGSIRQGLMKDVVCQKAR